MGRRGNIKARDLGKIITLNCLDSRNKGSVIGACPDGTACDVEIKTPGWIFLDLSEPTTHFFPAVVAFH